MKDETDNFTMDLLGEAEPQISSLLPVEIELPAEQNAQARANSADFATLQDEAKTYARTHLTGYLIKQGYKPTGFHTYTDEHGQPLYWKVRLRHADKGKTLRAFSINDGRPVGKDQKPVIGQFMPVEPSGKWAKVYPAGHGKKPLYRLAEIMQADKTQPVYIFEGEQKADLAASFGLIATTCGSSGSIATTHLEPLAGRSIVIWADNDEAGIKARDELIAALQAIGCTVSYVDVDALGLPIKGDIVDWHELRQQAGQHTNRSDIEALPIIAASEMTATIEPAGQPEQPADQQQADSDSDIEQQIESLARLSLMIYEQCRKSEAERLGIRPAILDKFVNNARKELEAIATRDSFFDEVEPWSEPVNGSELLEQIRAVIERHIVCQPATTTAAALWIMFTWCIDAVQIAPIACITAPEKRCGKTQLLTLIGELCYKPMPVSNITAAALFRSIEKWQPTLLIDEADSFMKENEDLRGIINAGHGRKNAYVIRTTGDNHEPTRFTVWGAKAISGIGHLPETLKDRSIILELRRKQAHETRQRLRHADPLEFDLIRRKLCRWSMDNMEAISQARPELPDALNDRAQDNWEALLAIADLLGGDWSKKARHAAMTISGVEEQSLSINEELLGDIKAIFERTNKDRLFTDELLSYLCTDDELSWATWNRGRPITPRQLAGRLREFGIISKTVRNGTATRKGYDLAQFKDAFTRYLPNNPFLSVTPTQPSSTNAYSDILSVTQPYVVTDEKTLEPLQHKACNAVTDKTPLIGGSVESSVKPTGKVTI